MLYMQYLEIASLVADESAGCEVPRRLVAIPTLPRSGNPIRSTCPPTSFNTRHYAIVNNVSRYVPISSTKPASQVQQSMPFPQIPDVNRALWKQLNGRKTGEADFDPKSSTSLPWTSFSCRTSRSFRLAAYGLSSPDQSSAHPSDNEKGKMQ